MEGLPSYVRGFPLVHLSPRVVAIYTLFALKRQVVSKFNRTVVLRSYMRNMENI